MNALVFFDRNFQGTHMNAGRFNRQRAFGSGTQRGGIRTLALVAVITLVLVGAVIGLVMNTYQRNQPVYRRKALIISDYGLQQTLEKLLAEPSWHEGFPRTDYLDGWFVVSMETHDSASVSSLAVVSDGHVGNQTRRQVCILQLSTDGGDSVWVQQDIRQE